MQVAKLPLVSYSEKFNLFLFVLKPDYLRITKLDKILIERRHQFMWLPLGDNWAIQFSSAFLHVPNFRLFCSLVLHATQVEYSRAKNIESSTVDLSWPVISFRTK